MACRNSTLLKTFLDTSGTDIPEDKSEPMHTLGEETDCSTNLERNSHTHQNQISMELTFLKEKSETQIHTSGKTDIALPI